MRTLAIFTLSILLYAAGHSQAAITGLTCVTKGAQYLYVITGADSSTAVQVCATGGTIAGATGGCITGNGLSQVQVTWNNDTASSGTVTLTAGTVIQTLNTALMPVIDGGSLDTSVKTQFIDSSATPAAINCTAATGGACSPSFSYQWQQSPDNLTWVADSSATGQNLSFSGPIIQNTYYRRQTFEATSGTYAYSDSAVVFLVAGGTAYLHKEKLAGSTAAVAKISVRANKAQHS